MAGRNFAGAPGGGLSPGDGIGLRASGQLSRDFFEDSAFEMPPRSVPGLADSANEAAMIVAPALQLRALSLTERQVDAAWARGLAVGATCPPSRGNLSAPPIGSGRAYDTPAAAAAGALSLFGCEFGQASATAASLTDRDTRPSVAAAGWPPILGTCDAPLPSLPTLASAPSSVIASGRALAAPEPKYGSTGAFGGFSGLLELAGGLLTGEPRPMPLARAEPPAAPPPQLLRPQAQSFMRHQLPPPGTQLPNPPGHRLPQPRSAGELRNGQSAVMATKAGKSAAATPAQQRQMQAQAQARQQAHPQAHQQAYQQALAHQHAQAQAQMQMQQMQMAQQMQAQQQAQLNQQQQQMAQQMAQQMQLQQQEQQQQQQQQHAPMLGCGVPVVVPLGHGILQTICLPHATAVALGLPLGGAAGSYAMHTSGSSAAVGACGGCGGGGGACAHEECADRRRRERGSARRGSGGAYGGCAHGTCSDEACCGHGGAHGASVAQSLGSRRGSGGSPRNERAELWSGERRSRAVPAFASLGAYGEPARGAAGGGPAAPKFEKFESLLGARGSLVSLAEDQHSSRWIQQQLGTASATDVRALFDEVRPHTLRLVGDVFANYVLQKLLEVGSDEMVAELARAVRGCAVALALQMHSCRFLQKLLEVAALAQQLEIVAELAPSALRCVCDQNANHVVQKVIEQVPAERAELILAELSGHALSLSSHSYGCRVLQRALEYGSDAQRARILAELLPASASVLCADQYGNYVMQSVVQLCEPHARACVAAAVLERAREYATHKFASNVVEKVLQFGTEAQRDALVARLLGAPADGGALADVGVAFDAIDLLVRDAFGNYVLQRAVDVCSPAHRSLIALYAQSNLAALSTMTYGKHLLAKLDRLDRLETPRGRAAQFGGGGGGGHGGGHGEGSRGRREREGSARSSR
jgi:hypothetical protein